MKRIITYTLPLLFILMIISCSKEEDSTQTTTTGATTGSDPRDVYVGTFRCNETSSLIGTTPPFDVVITKSTTASDQILIYNIYNLGSNTKAYAIIQGSQVTIPNQPVAGNFIQGTGTLQTAVTLALTYTVNLGGTTDNVSATLTKK